MARSADEFKEALGEHLSALVDSLSKEEDFRRVLESGLDAIDQGALSWARLNQLMHLASEAGMSEGFYRYYFLEAPAQHPYPVTKVFSDGEYSPPHSIKSIASYRQLQWGIRRLMYDKGPLKKLRLYSPRSKLMTVSLSDVDRLSSQRISRATTDI